MKNRPTVSCLVPEVAGMTDDEYKRLRARFYRQVRIGDECWEWTGATKAPSQHGKAGVTLPHGKLTVEGKTEAAHRVSFRLSRGRRPRMKVLHTCDNPRCVRPDHLVEGTLGTNMKHAWARGRRVAKASAV